MFYYIVITVLAAVSDVTLHHQIPGDCKSLLTLHCQDLQKCPAPGLLGVQHVSQGWKSACFCVCPRAGVCVQSSRRLTHCCYASYEWLKCVLGLNVSWGVTSGERHLCLPASLRTSITIGWTCGAWLVAIKDYITVASIYTAEQGRTAAARSPLRSLSCGFDRWEQPLASCALPGTSCC